MATKTSFLVQTFEKKRGRLVPGARDVAPTKPGALKRAEAQSKRMPGAAALQLDVDDESGEILKATILETFGEVPDDFADSLMGG